MNVTRTLGDSDADGDYDRLFVFGGRSFSIWDTSGTLIFDSGDAFERITAERYPTFFNASNANNTFDGKATFAVVARRDFRGSEPPEKIRESRAEGVGSAPITEILTYLESLPRVSKGAAD